MSYNFRTQKGKITVANTEIEEGYYRGEQIKKVERDVLFVEDGRYTTCDAGHPHFYFYSPRMKIITREVVIAEPVFFYIADVPVFALPFGVFPNRSGRRSGIIAPAYGEDARFGRYFSHFGYYWAISDYLDAATAFDWYARGGWKNNSLLRYALRYHFQGSVSASVSNRFEGEPGDPGYSKTNDYNVSIMHSQTIDPTARMDVNFTFTSGDYFRNTSTNFDDILRQNIISNATVSKSWPESNRSLSVGINRDQSLVTDDVTETLPSISFSQGQFFPFRASRRGGTAGLSDLGWYETIGVTYSASARNARSKISQTVDSVYTDPLDTDLGPVTEFRRRSEQTLAQSMSLSYSPKLGHFTL
ncbi:MAG: putative LPS assembly protein LptD, partial [Bacteroidota bacterium]